MKLWGGRFNKLTDKLVDDFHSSISFDCRLYKYDIIGSMAHVEMLGKTKIISQEESAIIKNELEKILEDIEAGKIDFEIEAEDIHMNVEKILISRIGNIGKKLHTGRSRNDQVALDLKMYLKDEINNLIDLLINLSKVLIDISNKNLDTIMPGYTHLQRAQPITFAHHLMAYFMMFKRDIQRLIDCYERTDIMPLGSGALAGTTYSLDRDFVATKLSFNKITQNSLDAVSDRDFVIELSSCLSILMVHLSRFSEEIVLWSSSEFSFIELDDSYSTGSSIMPQKKNPDIAELVRGKSGRVFGNNMSLLTVMKSLPLAYNKDMQEDKEAIFDSIDTVKMCLPIFSKMISTFKVNKESLYTKAQGGFTNATDLADYLVKKGIPFRDSHKLVGELVTYCLSKNKNLLDLNLKDFHKFSKLIDIDIFDEISLEKCISQRNLVGGPSKEAVSLSIEKANKFLQSLGRT
ncbi:MAG: argininosuccinate lyase [Clostridiales bacterium]